MARESDSTPVWPATKQSLGARALEEMKKYVIITLYLWVLFALFALYKKVLLKENGIGIWNQSYAIVNAMIFAKVLLLGEMLNLGKSLRKAALIWVVLGKSFLFTILLILFHIAEESIRAWFEHLPVADSILNFGGGTLLGVYVYAALIFVTLVPLFAFREVSVALGKNVIWKLMFSQEQASR